MILKKFPLLRTGFKTDTFYSPSTELKPEDRVKVNLKSLISLAAQSRGLNLHHSGIKSLQSGEYLSPYKGRGMEFDEVRLYQAGDDIRTIDWKVTARTGKPHTKIFCEERERPVYISVDNRLSMQFASRGVFKSVQAAKVAALIAWAAQQCNDRIGGQVFSEDSCFELKPQHGRYGVLRFFNSLIKPMSGGHMEFSFERTLSRLLQHAKPGSLLYLISDFRGFNEKAEMYLAKLARHCRIVLVFIYDPLEKALPEQGRYRFTDGQHEVVLDSSDKMRLKRYQQRFSAQELYLHSLAQKLRLNLIFCATTDEPLEKLR